MEKITDSWIITISINNLMSSHPLVSVIMHNFNGGKYISPSIKSFLNQLYTNKELIISNAALAGKLATNFNQIN